MPLQLYVDDRSVELEVRCETCKRAKRYTPMRLIEKLQASGVGDGATGVNSAGKRIRGSCRCGARNWRVEVIREGRPKPEHRRAATVPETTANTKGGQMSVNQLRLVRRFGANEERILSVLTLRRHELRLTGRARRRRPLRSRWSGPDGRVVETFEGEDTQAAIIERLQAQLQATQSLLTDALGQIQSLGSQPPWNLADHRVRAAIRAPRRR